MRSLHYFTSFFLLCAAALVSGAPNPQYNNFLPAEYTLDTPSIQPPPQALDIAFSPDNTHSTGWDGNNQAVQPEVLVPNDAPFQLARAGRQPSRASGGGCGLPICGGEISYYRFGPRDTIFCGSKGRHSSSVKLVALPAWFMNRSYCGKYLTLTRTDASGRLHTTRALIGDKCPYGSCVSLCNLF